MDPNTFRQSHLGLISGSPNCSEGHFWVWQSLGQCLERTEQTLGFVCGIVAVFLWTAAHVTIYKLQRQHARRADHMFNIRVFLTLNWMSDVFGCVGAVLAQQLTTQIIFSLSAVFVNTVCSAHYLITPLTASRNFKKYTHRRVYVGKNLPARLIKCLLPLIAVASLLTLIDVTSTLPAITRDVVYVTLPQEYFPALWIVGYTLGTLGAIPLCGAKLVDICDSHFTSECNVFISFTYSSSILAQVLYVISVCTQSQSLGFFYHSLPWTLPRLICTGFDIGISVQRIIQKRRTIARTLSKDDTACLISDTDYGDMSTDESEEVIWVPLKTIQLPQHPVTTSRIQILSESDGLSDKVEYLCDSGQFSMSDVGGQQSVSDPGGPLTDQDLGGQQSVSDPGGPLTDQDLGGQQSVSDPGGPLTDQDLMATSTSTGVEGEMVVGDVDKAGKVEATGEEKMEIAVAEKSSNDNGCGTKVQSNSDETSTSTDDDVEEEGKKGLERQISSLSAVSSEEKIAVWIQSAPGGDEMITHSEA